MNLEGLLAAAARASGNVGRPGWVPQDDDKQAMELAKAIGAVIVWDMEARIVTASKSGLFAAMEDGRDQPGVSVSEPFGESTGAAMRLAILKLAAQQAPLQ